MRRRRWPWVAAALIVLIVAGSIAGVLEALSAERQAQDLQARVAADFSAGQSEMEAGRAELRKANNDRSLDELSLAKAHFKAAAEHFAAAPPVLIGSSLIKFGQKVPYARQYLAPRVAAVAKISAMGVELAEAAQEGVDLDANFVKDTGGGGVAKLVPVLKTIGPAVDHLRQHLKAADADAAQIDLTTLTSSQRKTVTQARATVAKGLASIDDLSRLLPAAVEILGGNGLRTYLVEQMDPAELRGGGGFIGTYSVLTADQGTLNVIRSGSINAIDNPRPNAGQAGYVAPPPALRELIGDTGWELEDSNFYADFASNAQAGETLLQHQLGIKTDGVIAIDPNTIQSLLALTGPIAVAGYGITVQADGFVNTLFNLEEGPNRKSNRKDFIAQMASQLFSAVAGLPSGKLPSLVDALNTAAQSRHLQAYFNNPTAEGQVTTYGWSGAMNPSKATDFFLENESNLGATIANYYVSRGYQVTATRTASGIHFAVSVTVINKTPYSFSVDGGSQYRGYVRFYVAATATNLVTTGLQAKKYARTDIPPGATSVDGWFVVEVSPRTGSGTTTFTFSYDQPWVGASNNPQRLYWQKQPGTGSDGITINWINGDQHYTATSDLSSDRLVEFEPNALNITVGQPASAHLPSLSL